MLPAYPERPASTVGTKWHPVPNWSRLRDQTMFFALQGCLRENLEGFSESPKGLATTRMALSSPQRTHLRYESCPIQSWSLSLGLGNQEVALKYLKMSIKADSSDDQTWYILGRCYMAQKKYRRAYDAYQQVPSSWAPLMFNSGCITRPAESYILVLYWCVVLPN